MTCRSLCRLHFFKIVCAYVYALLFLSVRLLYISAMMMEALRHYKLTVTLTYVLKVAVFTNVPLFNFKFTNKCKQPEENFYTCAWSYDTETGESLLVVAGFKGIIRVIETSHVTCRAVSEWYYSVYLTLPLNSVCVCVCVCV